jgi:hypothetical protein
MRKSLPIQGLAVWIGNEEFEITWFMSSPRQTHDVHTLTSHCKIIEAVTLSEGNNTPTTFNVRAALPSAPRRTQSTTLRPRDGGWSVIYDPSRSFTPTKNADSKVDYTAKTPDANVGPGLWGWTSEAGYFGTFGGTGADDMLSQMADWSSEGVGASMISWQMCTRRCRRRSSCWLGMSFSSRGSMFMDRVLCIVPWIIVVFRKESSSQWESRRRLMGHEVGRPVSEVN